MLVCSIVYRPPRSAIAAGIIETAIATDANTTSNIVFATLVDDPASVIDRVDAYLGQVMLEAASAADTLNAGLAHVRAIVEAATANSTQDATVTSGVAYATWDAATVAAVTLSGGNLVATNTGTTSANQGARVATTSGRTTGKYYFETTTTANTGGVNNSVGIGTTASTYTNMGNGGTTGDMLYVAAGTVWSNGANTGTALGVSATGQLFGIAVDLDNRRIWFRKGAAGNWNNSGTANPATNVGGVTIPAGTMVPFVAFGGSTGVANNIQTANFGASAFTGAAPSGFTAGWPA